jgi:hypothetical protein
MAMKNSISALLGGRMRMTRNNIGGMAINLIPARRHTRSSAYGTALRP